MLFRSSDKLQKVFSKDNMDALAFRFKIIWPLYIPSRAPVPEINANIFGSQPTPNLVAPKVGYVSSVSQDVIQWVRYPEPNEIIGINGLI